MFHRSLDPTAHLSEQQVIERAQKLATTLLNSVTLVAALSAVLLPHTPESQLGVAVLALLAGWALYRLITRSTARIYQIIDYCYVLGVAVSVPVFGPDPQLLYTNSVPQMIVATAVITFAIALPRVMSFAAALVLVAAYAGGRAQVAGWAEVVASPIVFYLAVIWAITATLMVWALSVARAVDQARAVAHDAAVRDGIAAAVRDYELEHLALVHDTAASTLYLVGEGTDLSSERVAAQARRDLALLAGEPAAHGPQEDVDVVTEIRTEAQHVSAAVLLTGLPRLVLHGSTAHAVVAVVREALNNAERHARATQIVIDITADAVTVTDDGIGFDPETITPGHGVAESIIARMQRAHGVATVTSKPGHGTTVTVNWPQLQQTTTAAVVPTDDDVDQLAERILVRFGLGVVAVVLVQLMLRVPYAATYTDQPGRQYLFGAVAAVVALAGLPRVLGRGPNLTVPALLVLAAVVAAQAMSLPVELLGGRAQWPLRATGLCILPFVLRLRIPLAAGVLLLLWLGIMILNFVRDPGMATAYNLALYTAAVPLLQLAALAFPQLLRDATAAAAAEMDQRWAKDAQRRIAEALHDDYVQRTSKLVRGVFPLLQTLSTGTFGADPEIRRQARIEARGLRLYVLQAHTYSHPLVTDLRSGIDDADRRGVRVTLHADHHLPQLDEAARRRLLKPIQVALAHTTHKARIDLAVTPREVIASIISDTGTDTDKSDPATISPRPGSVDAPRIEVTAIDNTRWVSVHHELAVDEVLEENRAAGII